MKDNNRKKFPWPEFWAVVCGAICLLQGTFFCMMIVHYYQWRHGVVLWHFVEPYWFTIPQLLLCLTGMVLTVRRFIKKREGLAIKKIEWIPLIVSYAFSLIYLFLN